MYTRINRNTKKNFLKSRERTVWVSITVNAPTATNPQGSVNKPGMTFKHH